MSKQSGLGDRFFLDGYDLSGDVGQLDTIRGGPSPLVVTDITESAMDRLGGKKDSEIRWKSWFNPATNRAHDVLSPLPLSSRHAMYCRGTAVGSYAACLVGDQVNYDPTRGDDGSLSMAVQVVSSDSFPLEWGQLLTPGRVVQASATNGADLVGAGATAFGAVLYLQVFAFTGTGVIIKVQDSADGVSWADLAGGTFTTVNTAPRVQRLAGATNATVRQHVRAVSVSSGGFTSVDYAVAFVRGETAVEY